jgi:hypothetical protein
LSNAIGPKSLQHCIDYFADVVGVAVQFTAELPGLQINVEAKLHRYQNLVAHAVPMVGLLVMANRKRLRRKAIFRWLADHP